ncbi:hypothetical protein PV327_005060 [Microctonus hyperodae]|uniref:Uncharacterized protein n=1 Tax=Microctonus hyperodae TaxID=165561 RepID=A0AA39G0L1_MICHY|nr:hypothetical protein PV327_005060 [Microctonus hyperodae]
MLNIMPGHICIRWPRFATFGLGLFNLSLCNTTRMKYSPKQQQKERKSESEVMSTNGTPLKTFRCTNSTRRCIFNRINNDNNVISTGMFAWMRVFRMATLLPKVGC